MIGLDKLTPVKVNSKCYIKATEKDMHITIQVSLKKFIRYDLFEPRSGITRLSKFLLKKYDYDNLHVEPLIIRSLPDKEKIDQESHRLEKIISSLSMI